MKKFLCFGYFFLCTMVVCSNYASAYIDPSAMTYVIQAVAGVFIAGGAAIGVFRHRIIRFFKNLKNKKKDHEK